MMHSSTSASGPDQWKAPTLQFEEGWTGEFTREQANGALTNGTRVAKINSEAGDRVAQGLTGTILGSIGAPPVPSDSPNLTGRTHRVAYVYFVEWDHLPRTALMAFDYKVEPAATNKG